MNIMRSVGYKPSLNDHQALSGLHSLIEWQSYQQLGLFTLFEWYSCVHWVTNPLWMIVMCWVGYSPSLNNSHVLSGLLTLVEWPSCAQWVTHPLWMIVICWMGYTTLNDSYALSWLHTLEWQSCAQWASQCTYTVHTIFHVSLSFSFIRYLIFFLFSF
jgi:hypothetical protein